MCIRIHLNRFVNKVKRDGSVEVLCWLWFLINKKIENKLPNRYRWYSVQLQWLPFGTVVRKHKEIWVRWKVGRNDCFYFPKLRHHRRGRKGRFDFKHRMYSLDDFVEIEEEDTVFDVGAFIGEYSIAASNLAETVIAIEPEPVSAKCAALNTSNSVKVLQKAAWSGQGSMELKLGEDSSQDSLIEPDNIGSGENVKVETDTISNIASDIGVSQIDFLKVEAEGVEPEILQGIDEVKIKKIAVDAGAERYGEDVIEEVTEMLQSKGFETRINGKYVFAREK